MKKIILGVLLSISLSLACDAPYEEIQGVKIGCEFVVTKNFNKVSGQSLSEAFYKSTKDIKFFDSMEVEVNKEGMVIGVSFAKEYDITMSNMKLQEDQAISDFKQFAESLQKRWGAFDQSSAKGIFSRMSLSGTLFMRDINEVIVNNDPKSDVLGGVALVLQFKTNDKGMMQGKPQKARLILAYISKSTAEEIQKEKESVTDGF